MMQKASPFQKKQNKSANSGLSHQFDPKEKHSTESGVPLFLQRLAVSSPSTSPLVQRQPDEEDTEQFLQTKPSTHPHLQRLCPEFDKELENNTSDLPSIHIKSEGSFPASNKVAKTLQLSGSGSPLPEHVRSKVEPVLGDDLSHVRVHSDHYATQAAVSFNAKAFTHKNHIYMGQRQNADDISLMSHELAHVLQREGSDSQQIDTSDRSLKPLHNVSMPIYLRKANLKHSQSKQHIALKPLYENPYQKKPKKLYEIINITDKVVETGKPMIYRLNQTRHALLPANVSHNFSWFLEHNTDDYKKAMAIYKKMSEKIPFLEALLDIPKIILGPRQSSRRLWITKTLIPGVHRIKVEVFLGENYQTTLVLTQQVTHSGISDEFAEMQQLASQIKSQSPEEFGYTDIVKWKLSNRYLREFKEHFVNTMKNTIKKAAAMFDIPEVLLAGVAYIEVGGKDPIKRFVYEIRDTFQGKEARLKTSLGPMAIQVRRASEALGHDPLKMNAEVEAKIVEALYDPKQAIFIAAKHLSDLRNIDFPDKSASQLTWVDIEVIGARYNQGPNKSLAQIKKDLSYGKTIRRRAKQLEYLIAETTTLPRPAFEPIKEHVEEPLIYKYYQLEKKIERWYFNQMGPFFYRR